MTTHQENLVDWLRDAHALEEQIETLLKGQADRLEHYPDLRLRYETHQAATVRHQEVLKNALARLGDDTSALKDVAAKIMATGQNLVGCAMSDEVVKSAMTLYVFTHVAISSYTVLIAAADGVNDFETNTALKSILDDQISMSDWLLENLPSLTQAFLSRSASSSETAKR